MNGIEGSMGESNLDLDKSTAGTGETRVGGTLA
jgi:hypothetical protein